MDRLAKVEHMRIRILEMSKLIQKSGIPDNYLRVPKDSEKLKASFVDEGYKWLEDIYNTVFKEATKVWALLPELLWVRYFAWGYFEDHREMIMLKAALLKLSTAIKRKSRPDFFKKGKINAAIKKATGSGNRKSKKRVSETK